MAGPEGRLSTKRGRVPRQESAPRTMVRMTGQEAPQRGPRSGPQQTGDHRRRHCGKWFAGEPEHSSRSPRERAAIETRDGLDHPGQRPDQPRRLRTLARWRWLPRVLQSISRRGLEGVISPTAERLDGRPSELDGRSFECEPFDHRRLSGSVEEAAENPLPQSGSLSHQILTFNRFCSAVLFSGANRELNLGLIHPCRSNALAVSSVSAVS